MISQEATDAYNSRLTVDITKIRELTPSQRDQVKAYGSQAEALLKNRELAQFVHHYRFLLTDQLGELAGHTAEANLERIAIANQLSGLSGFITSLKRAVYYRNRVVDWEQTPQDPPKDHVKQIFDPKNFSIR